MGKALITPGPKSAPQEIVVTAKHLTMTKARWPSASCKGSRIPSTLHGVRPMLLRRKLPLPPPKLASDRLLVTDTSMVVRDDVYIDVTVSEKSSTRPDILHHYVTQGNTQISL